VNKQAIALGAGFGFLAVLLGAFGAHALRDRLGPDSMAIYQTGIHYQLAHALALILVGVISEDHGHLTWCRRLFGFGIVLFSFSLYLLAFTGTKGFGAITPLGGVCFLAGWAFLVAWAVKKPV
jgi:uncharacterized membrane protein YgdD (TMEM256/DUF423 family)